MSRRLYSLDSCRVVARDYKAGYDFLFFEGPWLELLLQQHFRNQTWGQKRKRALHTINRDFSFLWTLRYILLLLLGRSLSMMADGTHVTNACMCVLMLGMGTVLLTMLLKYYSTIPFVNRNTVTYLLTFIFCIIFGIIIIQVLSTIYLLQG